jgi:DNA-directed RNA polymerase subunit RPC12/RpoP
MGRLSELEYNAMKYPFGRCTECGEEFNSELRNEYHITHCPYCGTEIDDFLSMVDSAEEHQKRFDLFCDGCGRRIYEAAKDGEGGNWIDERAGVCGDGCGKELCGKCGDWHPITGMCAACHEENLKHDTDGSYRA